MHLLECRIWSVLEANSGDFYCRVNATRIVIFGTLDGSLGPKMALTFTNWVALLCGSVNFLWWSESRRLEHDTSTYDPMAVLALVDLHTPTEMLPSLRVFGTAFVLPG